MRRRTTLMSDRMNATKTPTRGPISSAHRKHTMAITNSARLLRHSPASSRKPSSGTTATATIAPIAGLGMSASNAVPKITSSRVSPAATIDGSCVRVPEESIAAVREAEEPTVNAPVSAGRDVRAGEREQVAVRVGLVAVLLRVAPRHQQALGDRHERQRDRAREQRHPLPKVIDGQVNIGGPASTCPRTSTPYSSRWKNESAAVVSTSTTRAHGIAPTSRRPTTRISTETTEIATDHRLMVFSPSTSWITRGMTSAALSILTPSILAI